MDENRDKAGLLRPPSPCPRDALQLPALSWDGHQTRSPVLRSGTEEGAGWLLSPVAPSRSLRDREEGF